MSFPQIHDHPLIAISVVIAFFASYAAIDLIGRVGGARSGVRHVWIASAALALGSGYWAMHIVSMLAYYPPDVRIEYEPALVAASLGFAVAASAAGLMIVARAGMTRMSVGMGGLCTGLGLVNTQVLGFMAIHANSPMDVSFGFVLMATTLSIGAGVIVTYLAFSGTDAVRCLLAAVCMTLAVTGEHYVTLLDIRFGAPQVAPGPEVSQPGSLGIAIASGLCALLFAALCASHVDRRTSAALEREAEALRASDRRFRLLVDGLRDHALLMLDARGEIAQWNDGATRLTGYPEAEALGSAYDLLFTDADRSAGVPVAALSAASGGEPHTLRGTLRRRCGTDFPSVSTLQPLRTRDGRPAGYAVLVRDVTAEHKAAMRLQETERALVQSQKMEAIGQLTGGIAHDFNNLLTVVLGHLEFAGRALADDDDARVARNLDGARNGAAKATNLTKRLLSFARKQSLSPRTLSPNEIVEGMVELLRRTLNERIDVSTALDPRVWTCQVDPGQLENAIVNLVINARDAMPNGGRIVVETRNSRADDLPASEDGRSAEYATIEVRDDGVGMDADTLSRAFDPFFTTKPNGQGTGLGLAMVYGFVRQSEGVVTIASAPGVGTTVALHFPRHVAADAFMPAALELGPPPEASGERVLVVEDDPEVRALCVETLRALGYAVVEAVDATSAEVALARDPVDVLFVDVGLPGADGLSVSRAARAANPLVDVVLTTGYGDAIDPEVEDEVGASDCLLKPYTPEQLARTIGGVVMSRRSLALAAA